MNSLARPDRLKPPIRILLVDDHAALRQALAGRLQHERGFEIVGQAGDGSEALERTRELRPDVIIMDLAMPRTHGVAAAKLIRESCPEARVIGFSIFADAEAGASMAEAGAFCFVSKREGPQVLIAAIRAAGLAGSGRSQLRPTEVPM
jgi:DNA-binding NarL/FixJ family response regulator